MSTQGTERKAKLRLKTIHDQAREIQRRLQRQEKDETEVLDEKILEMIQKENDIIYNDDYEYFQYFGKKKLDEESWRALHQEDEERYRTLKSKYVITQEKKEPQILLERDQDESKPKKYQKVEPLVKILVKRKEPEGERPEIDVVSKSLKSKGLVQYSSDDDEEDSEDSGEGEPLKKLEKAEDGGANLPLVGFVQSKKEVEEREKKSEDDPQKKKREEEPNWEEEEKKKKQDSELDNN